MRRIFSTVLSAALFRVGVRFRTPTARQRAMFTEVYRGNGWGNAESVSGPGSTVARSSAFRDELVHLLRELGVKSILDAPCGDFNWMRMVLEQHHIPYIGVDIVEELVRKNERLYGGDTTRFLCLDLTTDNLPPADLILCRDALVHLSFADIRAAIRNAKRSGAQYLLATTFVGDRRNINVRTGGWRPLNMEVAPFFFPKPLALIDEHCTHTGGIGRDKRLGLWEISSLAS